jgi:hypothetical protein
MRSQSLKLSQSMTSYPKSIPEASAPNVGEGDASESTSGALRPAQAFVLLPIKEGVLRNHLPVIVGHCGRRSATDNL